MPQVVKFAISPRRRPSSSRSSCVAFVGVSRVLGSSRVRGFAALLIGLTHRPRSASTSSRGQQRLTFGSPLSWPTASTSSSSRSASSPSARRSGSRRTCGARPPTVIPVGRPWLSQGRLGRSWKPWLRGTALGFPFGAIPAGGAEIPTFLSYLTERKLSKHPEEFGKGAIEGVAGPEAANNASAAGTLVPLLALGLPTNATAAIMLAALHELRHRARAAAARPRSRTWSGRSSPACSSATSCCWCSTCRWRRPGPSCCSIPRPYLYAGILFFASMGAYAVNGQPFDLFLLLGLGLLGFAMRRFGLPVLPLIVGVILGPLVEQQRGGRCSCPGGDASGSARRPGRLGLLRHRRHRAALAAGVEDHPQVPRKGGGGMTVLVGYVPNALGEAALTAAVEEARRRGEPLLVVNMSRDDVLVDARRAGEEQLARVGRDLAELGARFEVRQVEEGNDAADALLGLAGQEGVLGHRHRAASPHAGRQAAARLRRPARAARRPLPGAGRQGGLSGGVSDVRHNPPAVPPQGARRALQW